MDPEFLGFGAAALAAAAALAGAAVILVQNAGLRRRQDELLMLVRELHRGGVDIERILREEGRQSRAEAGAAARDLRGEVSANLIRLNDLIRQTLEQMGAVQQERLGAVEEQMRRLGVELRTAVQEMAAAQGHRLEEVRTVVQGRLDQLRQENEAKLEQMRQTVDEKLQGTLEKRLGESFGLVSKQLEQVHKSVGEMKTLADGVGDLKRVLTNVKTRGTWGEIALGNLLGQVMTPDQIATNAEIRPGSGERVEFAIRLPGRDEEGGEVLLPIDAKFPQEDYERLLDAAERGDKDGEEAALKALEARIRRAAQDICDKYVAPPHSTDFGVLYLPTEGLYAEVLRRPGLTDYLHLTCRVVVAGPTTLTAILNSLQMGFRSLAIQKRSSEVWQVLAAVKTEFRKYGEVLAGVQKKLRAADKDIEEGIGRRTRAIGRKLRAIESLSEAESRRVLQIDGALADYDDRMTLELEGERVG